MKQEKIAFESLELSECIKRISDDGLKTLLQVFADRLYQISVGNKMPLEMFKKLNRDKEFVSTWISEGIKSGLNADNPEHQLLVLDLAEKEFKRKTFEIDQEAERKFETKREKNSEFKHAAYYSSLNSLVNIWTNFEATIKQAWIYCLNTYPKIFFISLNRSRGGDIPGISGKNISLELLQKYEFNISNSLGSILYPKFDFTGLTGMDKSIQALISSKDLSYLFSDTSLNQLEIIRHLIVHCAGKIDSDFLKRTKVDHGKLDDLLTLNEDQIIQYGSSSIAPTLKVFEYLDNRIKDTANNR